MTREQMRLERRSIALPWSGCWIWDGSITRDGYGHLPFRQRYMGAHRASYLAFKGDIANGLDVCHQCDVKLCINPDHLFLGTRRDNMQDWTRKTGGKRGAGHHRAKLNEYDIIAIRADTRHRVEIAAAFGISPNHVNTIKRGGRWSHL